MWDDSEAREAGADDYIVKTPDLEYLIQAVSFIAKNEIKI